MRIRLLPSAGEQSASSCQFLTTFLINDCVAIDAGGLGFFASLPEQRGIRHVFLSHTHIDHTASLPLFLENVFTPDDEGVNIYGNSAVLESLEKDLFNNRVWPDFIGLSKEGWRFLELACLREEERVEVEGLSITPVAVDHTVPTFGFLVEEGRSEKGSAVAIVTDSGPTERIWDKARGLAHLKAVFLDASFPNSHSDLAEVSAHLTPSLFAEEVKKINREVKFLAVHIKAPHRRQVVQELEGLGIPQLGIAVPGKEYRF